MASTSLTNALRETLALFEGTGTPLTTTEVAERLDLGRRSTYERLARLVEHDRLETKKVGANGRVWWLATTRREDRSTNQTLERELRTLCEATDAVAQPIYVIDPSGTIEHVNPAFEEKTGYTAEEAIGQTPQLLWSADTDREGETVVGDGGRSDGVRREELVGTTKDGDRYVAEETVVPVEDDAGEIEAFVGVHLDAADREEERKDERERKRQREQLAALSHINSIFREITDTAIHQSTREEIEQAVCECLAEAGSYEFAWIGDVDTGSRTIRQRTEAGVEGYLDDVIISVDPDDERSKGPAGTALRTGDVQTIQDIQADVKHDPWRNHLEEYDVRSAAAIPIAHGGTTYGVLKVYAERPAAFEGPERAVLGQLGEVIGHAIAATERKQALMSDEIVTIEFQIPDMLGTWGVDSVTNGKISFDEVIATSDEAYLVYGTMDPEARETLESMTEQYEPWKSMRVISEDTDHVKFQIRSSESSIRSRVASEGGSVEEATLEDGELHLQIQLPPTVDVSSITETITEAYPTARFLSKRQFSRPEGSMNRIQRSLSTELTDRQRAVLESAYHQGYFEWPRDASGEEVADSLGISPPTFSQHLRRAERTLFDSVFSAATSVESD